jgi:hypothetical protein
MKLVKLFIDLIELRLKKIVNYENVFFKNKFRFQIILKFNKFKTDHIATRDTF